MEEITKYKVIETKELPLDQIEPPQVEYRDLVIEEDLEALARSLRDHKQLQPILVRKKDSKYEIIAGFQRYMAAKQAGMATIEAKIIECDDATALILRFVENERRSKVPAMSKARYFKRLLDLTGMSIPELAKKLHVGVDTIREYVRLLNAPVEIQDAVQAGHIGVRVANLLMQVTDPGTRYHYLRCAIENGVTERVMYEWVKQWKAAHERQIQADYRRVVEPGPPGVASEETTTQSAPPSFEEMEPEEKYTTHCEVCGKGCNVGEYKVLMICNQCYAVLKEILHELEKKEAKHAETQG